MYDTFSITERTIDARGRVVLPHRWTKKHGPDVIVIEKDGYLDVIPKSKRSR